MSIQTVLSVLQLVKEIVDKDGVFGLLTRGLGTRIVISGTQSIVFTVLWKLGQAAYSSQSQASSRQDDPL
jgi:hypothetical protein